MASRIEEYTSVPRYFAESGILFSGGLALLEQDAQGFYLDTRPSVILLSGIEDVVQIFSLTHDYGINNEGEVRYNVSTDGGTTWLFWDGDSFETGGTYAKANTPATLTEVLSALPLTGIFTYRAFLKSDGTQPVELERTTVVYISSGEEVAKSYIWPYNDFTETGTKHAAYSTSPSVSITGGFVEFDGPANSASVTPFSGIELENFVKFTGFTEILGPEHSGTTSYFFTTNDGITWYRVSGADPLQEEVIYDYSVPADYTVISGANVTGGVVTTTIDNQGEWYPNSGVSLQNVISIDAFSGINTSSSAQAKYNISDDDGATWFYFTPGTSGASSQATGVYSYNDSADYDFTTGISFSGGTVSFDAIVISGTDSFGTVQPTNSTALTGVTGLTSFAEILGIGNSGIITYNLSKNSGTNWYYWTGTKWDLTGNFVNSNSASVVDTNISAFSVTNTDTVLYRAFLSGSGVKLDENSFDFITPTVSGVETTGVFTYNDSNDYEFTSGISFLKGAARFDEFSSQATGDFGIVQPILSKAITGMTGLTAFTEALGGGHSGQITYNLTQDGGTKWLYWDSSKWADGGDFNNSNSASVVNTNITGLSVLEQETILYRAFLSGASVELDENTIDFITAAQFSQTTGIYTYDVAGDYDVSAEVTFGSSKATYNGATFGTAQPVTGDAITGATEWVGFTEVGTASGGGQSEFTSDGDTVALYHGNSTLDDAGPNNLDLVMGGGSATYGTGADSKFGGGALFVDGKDGLWYRSNPTSSVFDIAGGDFTFEFWYKTIVVQPAFVTVMSLNNGTDGGTRKLFIRSGSTTGSHTNHWNCVIFHPGGSFTQIITSIPISTTSPGTWRHIAATRQGSVLRLYHEGIQVGSSAISLGVDTVNTMIFGKNLSGDTLGDLGCNNVYIDEVRFSNVNRYPDGTSFTPNESPAGNISYNISKDAGTIWYYWTGAKWETGGDIGKSNPVADVNSNVSSFAISPPDQLLYRVFLSGTNTSIDTNEVIYEYESIASTTGTEIYPYTVPGEYDVSGGVVVTGGLATFTSNTVGDVTSFGIVQPISASGISGIDFLIDFQETVNSGIPTYNISKDAGSIWYYLSGTTWVTGGDFVNSTTASNISMNISGFDIAPSDVFLYRTFLEDTEEIDETRVIYMTPGVSGSTGTLIYDYDIPADYIVSGGAIVTGGLAIFDFISGSNITFGSVQPIAASGITGISKLDSFSEFGSSARYNVSKDAGAIWYYWNSGTKLWTSGGDFDNFANNVDMSSELDSFSISPSDTFLYRAFLTGGQFLTENNVFYTISGSGTPAGWIPSGTRDNSNTFGIITNNLDTFSYNPTGTLLFRGFIFDEASAISITENNWLLTTQSLTGTWVVANHNDVSLANSIDIVSGNFASLPYSGVPIFNYRLWLTTGTKAQVDQNELEYVALELSNAAPGVFAGDDKSAFQRLLMKPFSDCIINDEDPSGTTVFHKIEPAVSFTEITTGGNTAQEKARNYEHSFDSTGVFLAELKATDTSGLSTTDSLNVEVNLHDVTFYVVDVSGNSDFPFTFIPESGASLITGLVSPFVYLYDREAATPFETATFSGNGVERNFVVEISGSTVEIIPLVSAEQAISGTGIPIDIFEIEFGYNIGSDEDLSMAMSLNKNGTVVGPISNDLYILRKLDNTVIISGAGTIIGTGDLANLVSNKTVSSFKSMNNLNNGDMVSAELSLDYSSETYADVRYIRIGHLEDINLKAKKTDFQTIIQGLG